MAARPIKVLPALVIAAICGGGALADDPEGHSRVRVQMGQAKPAVSTMDDLQSIVVLCARDQNACKEKNCDAYAAKAVGQQMLNEATVCGLSGSRWSRDFAGHKNWCQSANVAAINLVQEDSAREAALQSCRRRDAVCGGYAALASEQNTINNRLKCGYSGNRWSNDIPGHKRWCLSRITTGIREVGPGDPIFETGQRDRALTQCTRGQRQLAETQFESSSQKSQQYINMLASVMKALKQMNEGIVRNIR